MDPCLSIEEGEDQSKFGDAVRGPGFALPLRHDLLFQMSKEVIEGSAVFSLDLHHQSGYVESGMLYFLENSIEIVRRKMNCLYYRNESLLQSVMASSQKETPGDLNTAPSMMMN